MTYVAGNAWGCRPPGASASGLCPVPVCHGRCSRAGYAYRVQRTAVAGALQSERCVWLASTLLLGALVAVGSLAPWPWELWLYEAAAWSPRAELAWWGAAGDLLVRGAMPPAALGLAYEARERWRRHDAAHGAFALLAIFNFAQSQLGPALLLCCCVYLWCRLSGELRGVAKWLLVRFGEAVLEVRR